MIPFEVTLHQERPIEPEAVRDLYRSVGWWSERQEQEIADVLSNNLAVGAWQGNHLVGFARAVSDHHFRAFIEDVVVHPNYQRMNIGSLLLAKLLGALNHIETITLFCHSELLPFYEQQGFQVYPSQKVMHWKRSIHNN